MASDGAGGASFVMSNDMTGSLSSSNINLSAMADGVIAIPNGQALAFKAGKPYLMARERVLTSADHHQPVSAGFSVRKELGKGFSVETGLTYTFLASDLHYEGDSEAVSQKLHYLGIPLRANWNFVCWGLYYFVLLTVEKLFLYDRLQRGRVWPHLYALFFIVLGWGLFAVDTDMGDIVTFFSRLFWPQGGVSAVYFARNYGVALAIGCLCSTPLPRRFYGWVCKKSQLLRILVLGVVFFLSVAYLVDSTYNPFIYFRF